MIKFVVTIVDDTAWNLVDQERCDCENKIEEKKCEAVKCAEPLTFVDYLIRHNTLLITIILITVILITISVIYIVKYKKLKKNIN